MRVSSSLRDPSLVYAFMMDLCRLVGRSGLVGKSISNPVPRHNGRTASRTLGLQKAHRRIRFAFTTPRHRANIHGVQKKSARPEASAARHETGGRSMSVNTFWTILLIIHGLLAVALLG